MKIDPFLEPLILASASPRRREILERMKCSFKVMPSSMEETVFAGLSPEDNAEELSKGKARAVAARLDRGTVVGCDTLVAVDKKILGKPASPEEAKRILTFLSGKMQKVISGLCLIHVKTGIELTGHEVTKVYTRPMSRRDVEDYVATGEGIDKAGAYAIQETGDRFIERLEGSFDNVVGFPTELFERLISILSDRLRDGNKS